MPVPADPTGAMTTPRHPDSDTAARGVPRSLDRFLRRARRVWWGVALRRSLAVAVGVAALVVPLRWLSALRAGVPGGLLADGALHLAQPLLVTFVVALAAAFAVAAWRAPSLLSLARRADRVLDQAQRLSTSFEVGARGGASTLLAGALIDDAELRAATLDWRPVGRTAWWRPAPALVAGALTIALLAAVVPVPALEPTGSTSASSTPVAPDRAVRDAATVERFAELLAAVSEQEDDPYLSAVASSFAELAQRLEAGTIDATEGSRVLEELVGHLEIAARDIGGAFGEAIEAALASADASAEAAAAGGSAGAGGEAGGPGETGDDGETVADDGAPPAGLDPAAATADASLYQALEDLANEFEDSPGSLGLRPPRPAFIDVGAEDAFYGGVGRAETDPNARPAEPSGLRSDAPGSGDVVGAAEQSSDRAGDAAGGGSADLGGGDDAFLGLEAETTTAATLPWNERADGQYTEVELVPDAVLGEARAFVRGTPEGPFRRTDEAASTANAIGAAYREVVSRYFMPGAVQAGGAP